VRDGGVGHEFFAGELAAEGVGDHLSVSAVEVDPGIAE